MTVLKELSSKNGITIISTIHQPNSDILQMSDNLYVLAKGGVCVYSGTPASLPIHLSDCGIVCNENQVPIETLISIASKGSEDNKVKELKTKSDFEIKELIENRLNETKVKTIIPKNKVFSFKDVYLLLNRKIIEFYSYKYFFIIMSCLSLLSTSLLLSTFLGGDAGGADDCIVLNGTNSRNCFQQIENDSKINESIVIEIFTVWMLIILQLIITITEKINRLKAFSNEHQNS